MSRSKKECPLYGGIITAFSEKDDKKAWHRAFRRKSKMIAKSRNVEETVFPIPKELSDPWQMAKDR